MARWATYRHQGRDRVGVVSAEALHAISEDVGLIDLIARGADGLRAAAEGAMTSPAQVVAVADVELRAPIPEPPSVRDSLCFLDHMRNCQQVTGAGRTLSDTWYRVPAFYFACPATVFGPYQDVPTAPGSAWQDFELEIAAVVGAAGADLSVEQAQKAIVGYTIFNDWSARDLQRDETVVRLGPAKGKDFASSIGPWLVTPDELMTARAPGATGPDLAMTAEVNGHETSRGRWSDARFSFGAMVARASADARLRPGDLLGSGTVGTGCLLEVRDSTIGRYLEPGDEVVLRIERLGALRTPIVTRPG